MNQYLDRIILVTLLFGVLSKGVAADSLRVAIIGEGDADSATAALAELLTAELIGVQDLELLERAAIADVLREQEVRLQLSGAVAEEQVVTAGRILGADSIVVVSPEPTEEKPARKTEEKPRQLVRIQVLDTERGVRFGKTSFVWRDEQAALDQQLRSTSRFLRRRLRRVREASSGLTVVSLAGFQTTELSREAHRVRRELEDWLEMWIAAQPGFAVTERTQVLPLIGERRIASDLEASLGDADAIVDGRFRIDFRSAKPVLELRVRVARKGAISAEQVVVGPLTELSQLRASLASLTLKLLSPEAVLSQPDTKAEASLLAENARRLFAAGRRCEASRRIEAAYALNPDDSRLKVDLLRFGTCRAEDDGTHVSREARYDQLLLRCDVARSVLDKAVSAAQPLGSEWYYKPRFFVNMVHRYCRDVQHIRSRERALTEDHARLHELYRAAVDDLYRHTLSVTKSLESNRPYLSTLKLGLESSHYWAETPEKSLAFRRELLESTLAAYEHDDDFIWVLTECGQYQLGRNPAWKDRKDLPQLEMEFLKDLAVSDDVFLRARAERALASWHQRNEQDHENAIKHYRRFIDIIIDELIPNHPNSHYFIVGDWLDYNLHSDRFLTGAEKGELWSRVIQARWERGCPKWSMGWVRRIKHAAAGLEESGRANEAKAFLREHIDQVVAAQARLPKERGDAYQWDETATRLRLVLSELEARHPSLQERDRSPAELAVDCRVVLTHDILRPLLHEADLTHVAENIKNEARYGRTVPPERVAKLHRFADRVWSYVGLLETSEGVVVCCAGEELQWRGVTKAGTRSRRVVLARLDQQGEVASTYLLPEKSEAAHELGNEFRPHHLWPIAADGKDLFIAPEGSGLIWFPWGKSPVHFDARFLKPSDGIRKAVPFNQVRELVPLGGKLYVKAGANPVLPKLYELDYQQGTTHEILDALSPPSGSPFQGREGFSLMRGSKNTLLVWTAPKGLVRRNPHAPVVTDLHLYDPNEGTFRATATPFLLGGGFFHLHNDYQPFKGVVQSLGSGGRDNAIALFDPRTIAIDWITPSDEEAKRPTRPPELVRAGLAANRNWALASGKIVDGAFINDWRKYTNVIVKTGNDANFDWLLYRRGQRTPRRVVAPNLPSPDEVKQFLIDEGDRVFMMTSKQVFRIDLSEIDASPRQRTPQSRSVLND